MFITDSRVHLYLPDTPDHPWPKEFAHRTFDQLEYLPSDLLPAMDGAGVDRAVVVPPVVAGWDNTAQLEWAAQYPDRFGVVGRFDLTDPDRDRLETWLDQPGMLGCRFIGGGGAPGSWFDLEPHGWFWASCERLGIPVMSLPQKEGIGLAAPVAERHPDLTLIIDHLGATLGNPAEIDPWGYLDETLALARYPNVIAKLSALPLATTEPYPFPGQTEVVRRAYDAFGPTRLAWGSDCSRYRRHSLAESVDHLLSIDFLSEDDRSWIMSKTISTALSWPEPDDA